MFAKVKDNILVQFPYGYDELQSEFSETLTGYIEIPEKFKQSSAYTNGFLVVPVVQENLPLTSRPGNRYSFARDPVLVDNQWILKTITEEIPIPLDGKNYTWNTVTQNWEIVQ